MRFGVFYELQLPRPWEEGDERNLFHQALEQVELADRLGFDYAWEVEHHFLEEYSHSSAPEVFLAAAAARTKSIRLGHGIRQVIPNYNHPARTAEGLATLDIISDGRVDFGIGEGATRLELGGFRIPTKEKRAMALEDRRSGWPAQTATPSRSRRRTASARLPSRSSTARRRRVGPTSTTASSNRTPAFRSAIP
jgi:luciferase-like monooxygenase